MRKIIFWVWLGAVFTACNSKPDYSVEIKEIDSLSLEVDQALAYCTSVDSSWVQPIEQETIELLGKIKEVYTPDSVIQDEAKLIGYYKGFKFIGNKFYRDKQGLTRELTLSKKQLANLKTDVENGTLTKEEIQKYLNQEKLVTIDLLSQFKSFREMTESVEKNYDSVQPLILKIIEVYSQIPEGKRNVVKNR